MKRYANYLNCFAVALGGVIAIIGGGFSFGGCIISAVCLWGGGCYLNELNKDEQNERDEQ